MVGTRGERTFIATRALLAELETARQPSATSGRVDPERAISYVSDLQSLWDAPVPEGEAYGALRYEYERRRADATAAGFAVLAALGPELVRAELADDPRTAAPLALTLAPERAELTGPRAEVFDKLMSGRRSRTIGSASCRSLAETTGLHVEGNPIVNRRTMCGSESGNHG